MGEYGYEGSPRLTRPNKIVEIFWPEVRGLNEVGFYSYLEFRGILALKMKPVQPWNELDGGILTGCCR